MPVTANQFNLDPSIGPSFSQGVSQGQQRAKNQNILAKQQLDRQTAAQQSQFSQQAIGGDQQALNSLAGSDADRALKIQSFLGNQGDSEREETVRENEVLTKAAITALSLPIEQRRAFIQRQRDIASEQGRSTERTDRALSGSDEELNQDLQLQATLGQEISAVAKNVFSPEKGAVGTASQRDFETYQNLLKTDPEKAKIFGRQAGFIRETEQQKADIDVSKTEKKEIIRQRVKRTSDIKTELSERNRNASRSSATLRRALTLAKSASQGLTGVATLQLSRLLPGIDASDEGALDQALKELALVQLQQFKGPTTDFEFNVTQAIAGSLGSSQSANSARIKSLDRNRFFNERELKQFNEFIKDKGDPDNFAFNFNEIIKTKKGPFTLQAIQDTAVEHTLTIEETIKRLNQ